MSSKFKLCTRGNARISSIFGDNQIIFGKNSMPDVDNLLTSFYQLDDEARQEVVETIRLKLQYHRDPKRAEQIKQIKGW